MGERMRRASFLFCFLSFVLPSLSFSLGGGGDSLTETNTKTKNNSSSLSLFHYEKYWKRAEKLALLEDRQVPHFQPLKGCLKIYIYNLSQSLQGDFPFEKITSQEWLEKLVFIKKNQNTKPFEFETPMRAEIDLFLYRLLVDNQRRKEDPLYFRYCGFRCELERARKLLYEEREREGCFLTSDPEQADFFFVPIHLEIGKWGHDFCRQGSNFSEIHHKKNQILGELVHLNPSTSCRHFFMHAQGTYQARNCKAWFSRPEGLFQNVLRIGGTPILPKHSPLVRNDLEFFEKPSFERVPNEFPYLISVPYPTNVHWSRTFRGKPPWANSNTVNNLFLKRSERPILMLYSSRATELHGDIPTREKILQACQNYQKKSADICHLDLDSGTLSKKENAVFCLEPMGDSPFRKSIFDSITYGCIPVLFSEITDTIAPYHWGGWRNRTRVLVSRKDFLEGRIDLKVLLESIPFSLLRILQQSIHKVGKRFQTSLQYDPGDSQSFILRGLVDKKGKCEADLKKRKTNYFH